MIPPESILRVARPTDNLQKITRMYCEGLGFELLTQFNGTRGFDGSVLGHPQHPYHLEFTQHRGTTVGVAPSEDHLLVFYIPDHGQWEAACAQMLEAGFKPVSAFNPYWDEGGTTFEDVDKYRVVLHTFDWKK